MRYTLAFTILAAGAAALPAGLGTAVVSDNHLERRAPPPPPPPIKFPGGRGGSSTVGSTAGQLMDMARQMEQEDKDARNKWVHDKVQDLASQNPHKNILIHHNQDSKMKLDGDHHEHYELPLHHGKTMGYEIHVFDKGWFELAGDGGYLNYGYAGNTSGNKDHLVFSPR